MSVNDAAVMSALPDVLQSGIIEWPEPVVKQPRMDNASTLALLNTKI